MIPQLLTLRNFFSYREATLDFQGLHTACICGPNGSGKSSLLEAIGWALWGQSRAASEDDVIHLGAREAQVDFIFQVRQQTYRVIRTRQRGQATSLEFQVGLTEINSDGLDQAVDLRSSFRTLTERGVRATQQLISEHLKLDFETFVNSAYLRQGRADEFMLKRATERKQILADLLKLDQYDQLAEQAKDQSRQFKAQVELIEQNLQALQGQLQQQAAIAQEQTTLESVLADLQQQQAADYEQLQTLQVTQQQRQVWEQQLIWQQQQQLTLTQDCQRLQQEFNLTQQQQQQLAAILQQEAAIVTGYAQFQALQSQEEVQVNKFQALQTIQARRQQLQRQQDQQIRQLQEHLWQAQVQLESLDQQEQEMQKVLSKANEVEMALEQLQQVRGRLAELDQLQAQVSPLLQRRQQIQHQLAHVQTRLHVQLEELQIANHQLQVQQQQQPRLQRSILEVGDHIEYLESRRNYQQQVRERGLERRSFLERLQSHQRECEVQLAKLDQKIQLLKQPDASCPLCDRPLDEHHWNLVLQKHQAEQEDILNQIWVLREQLAVSDQEIHLLRQEYRNLERELAQYGPMLEKRGQLQEQLQVNNSLRVQLEQSLAEQQQLEQQLSQEAYAVELQEELQLLDRNLQQLSGEHPYDERDHALARGEVERWRWAEIKQAEIKQARRRQAQIAAQQPELITKITHWQQQLEACKHAGQSPLQQQLDEIDRSIGEIGYDLEQHNALRVALRQAQPWQLRYQELHQAQQQHPQVQQRNQELAQTLQSRRQDHQAVNAQIAALIQQLEQIPNCLNAIAALEVQIQQRRSQLDQKLAQLGRLQQQHQYLTALNTQHSTLSVQLQTVRKQYRVYHELSQAFGKNGIQALMIENVLPQLETETNQILARLSANQLHVQFVTQRASKTKSKAQLLTSKLIDTLDILIADAQGTRPYETYSGGEAFRVNFAIRLALARLLAQRSGTALQMLIVDEGFGTQDEEGCDRLIAAINAIAPDFACILTITHMPHFKQAFQVRIEVCKTEAGSQLSLSV